MPNFGLAVGTHLLSLQQLMASPSASCTRGRPSCTRGSLPRVQHSGKSLRLILSRESRLPRVSKIVHSGKALPSAVLALGEDLTPLAGGRRCFFFIFFPECNTRERFLKFFFKILFAECRSSGTRGRNLFFFYKNPSSPSATAQALGEATSKILFFCFSM